MQSALDQALREAKAAGAERVHEIRLRVGVLSGVVPDALQFAFEAVTAGTPAEGATLAIESVAPRFWCDGCQREFEAADLFPDCPDCNTASNDLRAGRELELVSMEVEYV